MFCNQQTSQIVGLFEKDNERSSLGHYESFASDNDSSIVYVGEAGVPKGPVTAKLHDPFAGRQRTVFSKTMSLTAPETPGLQTDERTPNTTTGPAIKVSRQALREAALRLEKSHKAFERTVQSVTPSISQRKVRVLSSGQSDFPVLYKILPPGSSSSVGRPDNSDARKVGDFKSVLPVTLLSTKLTSYNLPSGQKAVRVRLPESLPSEIFPFEKHEKMQYQDYGDDASMETPSQDEEIADEESNNASLIAITPPEDNDQFENELESYENSPDDCKRDYYHQKWKEAFNQRNESTSDRPTTPASPSKSCKTAKSPSSISYDPPDEEVASVLWRLSLGQTVTIEEVDKVIMYLVKLKYTFCDKGSKVAQSQEREATHVEHPDRPASPSLEAIPEPPDSPPELPEPESFDDEPPVIEANPIRNSTPMKRRASSPKKVTPVKKAKMSAASKSRLTSMNIEATSESPDCILDTSGPSEIPEPGPSGSGPVAKGQTVKEPSSSAKVIKTKTKKKRVTKLRRSKGQSLGDAATAAVATDLRCKQCGMCLLTAQKLKTHEESCKGILVKRTLLAPQEGPTSPPEEERKNLSPESRKCLQCDEVFTCDKNFENHMVAAHDYSRCYEFTSEEDFQTWFKEENFHKTLYKFSKRNHVRGDLRIVYSCSNKFFKRKSGLSCPCQLVVQQFSDFIHASYYSNHNHTESRVRQRYQRREPPKNCIRVKWPQQLNEEASAPLEERKCQQCNEGFTGDKEYEMHMAAVHNCMWYFEFATEEEFQTWFHEERFHETMLKQISTYKARRNKYSTYECAYNKVNNITEAKDRCPCRMMVNKDEYGLFVRFNVLHNHAEKTMRPSLEGDKSILIKWPRPASVNSSVPPEEEERERECPQCLKVLMCDKDFELHMAVVHNYFWRFEFATEDEFQTWFRSEGLDETTVKRRHNESSSHITYKQYRCAFNNQSRKFDNNQQKCNCRVNVRSDSRGVFVKYHVLHNHKERAVRQQFTEECRQLVRRLICDGLTNLEILRIVKKTFPPSSINYMMCLRHVRLMRKRLKEKKNSCPVLPDVSVDDVPVAESSRDLEVHRTPPAEMSRRRKRKRSQKRTTQPHAFRDDDEDSIVILPSPKSNPKETLSDSDIS